MDREDITRLAVDRLDECRDEIANTWNHPEGTTTRHFHIDAFLPPEIAREAYAAFPKAGDGFYSRASFREKKRTSAHLDEYAPILREITFALQDPRVVDLIADIVGFRHIEPDPKLYAGGLSMMFKGDFLNPHIDNSHDAQRDRYRRLNALYYVSPDWQLENGGNFELWNDDQTEPKTIIAAENRLVVMETNKTSWHSVSPVAADYPRCCISNYYFSRESPDQSEYFHVTSFTGRPDEKVKRVLGVIDNSLRNGLSRTLKVGRGKNLVNPDGRDKGRE
jgi:Rps23 Pro-64 3,4-dihydroxylase Tpa1-like proline 4-hydroxylase